jgi:hypothetical protein
MTSIRTTTIISESVHTIDIIHRPGTLSCIESEHAGLLMYYKYEVASPLTPSTGEYHFPYDVAKHPNYSSKSGTL